jgi:predicted PurR-regulated permease PerM
MVSTDARRDLHALERRSWSGLQNRSLANSSYRRHEACLGESVTTRPSDPDPASKSTVPRLASAASVESSYVPRTRRWALIGVVLASFAAAAWVAHPLWVGILLGVVMAVSAHRPYEMLRARLGDKRATWAAGLVTLGSGILVAITSALVVLTLSNEMMKVVTHLNQHGGSGSLGGLIGERGAHAVQGLGVDTQRVYDWLHGRIEAAASYMATLAAVVVRTTSYAVLGLVVALMTQYYVLLEGPALAQRLERVAPLEPRHTRALIREAREVGRDAFLGTLATAVIQGVLAGVGYAVLGVPQPVTWAVATALGSFLPVIGTMVVWIPLAGYVLMDGHPVRALLLVVWGVLVVTSLPDYVIRPRIVGARGHGHPLLTLIALLGGIEVLGLAGLIVAPIVMSVFMAAFRLYEREVRSGALPPPGASSP